MTDIAQTNPSSGKEEKLFFCLSISNQFELNQKINKDQAEELELEHRDYHRPSSEGDKVLVKAMIRPVPGVPRGARCMLLKSDSLQTVINWVMQNPLAKYDAHNWDVRELTVKAGAEEFLQWMYPAGAPAHVQIVRPRHEVSS